MFVYLFVFGWFGVIVGSVICVVGMQLYYGLLYVFLIVLCFSDGFYDVQFVCVEMVCLVGYGVGVFFGVVLLVWDFVMLFWLLVVKFVMLMMVVIFVFMMWMLLYMLFCLVKVMFVVLGVLWNCLFFGFIFLGFFIILVMEFFLVVFLVIVVE